MKNEPGNKSILLLIASLAAVKMFIHLYTNAFAGYGIFRDEFYYLACSSRLDLGYVDHPPFSIYVLALIKNIFGDSLFAIRLIPALTGAAVVFLTGLLTKKIGGSFFAVVVSCTAVIVMPIFLAITSIYSMNVFDYLFWISAAYIVVLLIDDPKPQRWILLGIVLGLGLLNKIGAAWLGAGIFVGIFFSNLRSTLKTKWPYISAAIALIIFSPFIIWNFTHDFAHLEFINNASGIKYSSVTRIDFLIGQIFLPHPLSLLIWLPGLYYFLFNKEGKKYSILAIIYLTALIILILNGKVKPEYLGPAYLMLFAGGAVLIEHLTKSKKYYRIKYVFPVIIFISGILTSPLALPVLRVEQYISYAKTLGMAPSSSENKELSELPQFYADMFGWEEMAAEVSRVYGMIPVEHKKNTIVFTNNYGEAGALEYYKRKYPLPVIVSPHNNYWYWGLEIQTMPDYVIVIGGDIEDHRSACEKVEQAGIIKSRYAMPYENNMPVYICSKLKLPLKEIWYRSRFFI